MGCLRRGQYRRTAEKQEETSETPMSYLEKGRGWKKPETDNTLGRIYPCCRDKRNLLGAPPKPFYMRVVVRAGKLRVGSWDALKRLMVTDSFYRS